MSLREEDRQNKNCPSRGLGLAAAALGIGVGAALYYFFSKRPENPDSEGSTSTWECEQGQAFTEDGFGESREDVSNDSYITLSEHSTTDTSIHTSPCHGNDDCIENETSQYISEDSIDSVQCISDDDNETQSNNSMVAIDNNSYVSINSDSEISSLNNTSTESEVTPIFNENSIGSITDSDSNNDWDVTQSSLDVPEMENYHNSINMLDHLHSLVMFARNNRNERTRITDEEQMERARALSEEEQLKFLRDQAFRERTWSLEECSICFEVILKNQEVMSLPCTHHFHTACILPWLQEQQTCPNCRKAAE